MKRFAPAGPALALLLLLGCGEEGEPSPGYADPCLTAMGPTLGCPSRPAAALQPTVAEACEKLVRCGILAREALQSTGNACSTSADCKGGQCIKDSQGRDRCHNNYLDYPWCVGRFSAPRADICNTSVLYSGEQVEAALECIAMVPCASLGLPLEQKYVSREHRPDLDKLTCKNQSTTAWTATICDHGLLSYY